MGLTKHGVYLYKLTSMGWLNRYLVAESDGLTVIDTGIPRSAGSIISSAKEIGLPIRRIALTHAHTDHAGSLTALCEQLDWEPEVFVGEREARLLAGDKSLDPGEPKSRLGGSWSKFPVEKANLLVEGDTVGSLEVLAVPGHTPGQLAFIDSRDRSAIAGDAFQTLGGIAVAGVIRPLFPFMAFGTWDKQAMDTAIATARG